MAIRKSILMMTNTGTAWNKISEHVRGNAYYGYGTGICTIQIIYQNLVGGFGIQASLALQPKPEDWFYVGLNQQGNTTVPYITYPIVPLAPSGANGGDTGSMAFTFIGNFVWLRAVLTREYIQPYMMPSSNFETWQYGQLDSVRVSL